MPLNQIWSMGAGLMLVAFVDLSFDSIHLTGPGIEGALRAGFWYGFVGAGGGLGAYEWLHSNDSAPPKVR